MALPPVLTKIVGWLRAGYPEGVPQTRLHPAVRPAGQPADQRRGHRRSPTNWRSRTDPESAEAIKQAIATVTDTKPSDADVARVRAHLAAGGWPLATPDQG